MTIAQKIESILFALGEPVTLHELIGLTKENKEAIEEGIQALRQSLEGRGIILVESHEGYLLGSHPEAAPILESIRKDELGKELSKASLETLAIILYHNGASRSDIDVTTEKPSMSQLLIYKPILALERFPIFQTLKHFIHNSYNAHFLKRKQDL